LYLTFIEQDERKSNMVKHKKKEFVFDVEPPETKPEVEPYPTPIPPTVPTPEPPTVPSPTPPTTPQPI
jgi:hypothetical protein